MTNLEGELGHDNTLPTPDTTAIIELPPEFERLYNLQPVPPDSSVHPLRFILTDFTARHEAPRLLSYIRRRLPVDRWIDGEDVLQEVYLGLLENGKTASKLPPTAVEKELRPFTTGIAAHKIVDAKRKLFGVYKYEISMDGFHEELIPAPEDNTEEQGLSRLGREEASQMVEVLLSQLQPGHRRIIAALLPDPEQSTEELKQRLAQNGHEERSLGAIRVAKHRALQVSRNLFDVITVLAYRSETLSGTNQTGQNGNRKDEEIGPGGPKQ